MAQWAQLEKKGESTTLDLWCWKPAATPIHPLMRGAGCMLGLRLAKAEAVQPDCLHESGWNNCVRVGIQHERHHKITLLIHKHVPETQTHTHSQFTWFQSLHPSIHPSSPLSRMRGGEPLGTQLSGLAHDRWRCDGGIVAQSELHYVCEIYQQRWGKRELRRPACL